MSTKFEDLVLRDIAANRPAAGKPGRLFFDTTNVKLQRDNGSTWDDVESTAATGLVDDTAYNATSWNGDTTHAPSKNAVRDKIESMSSGLLLIVQDQKTSGTNGGTFTSGAWRTRDLNTVVLDEIGGVTLSSNAIVLPAGTYRGTAWAPGYRVNQHQARLYDATNAAVLALGSSEFSVSGSAVVTNKSVVVFHFVLTGTANVRVEHQCVTTSGSDYGFGVAVGIGTEVYTQIELLKVA